MSIEVKWGNSEKTIILWDIQAKWSFEDFLQAGAQAEVLANAIEHQFDLLINANNFPPPPFPLVQFKRAMEEADPRMRYMVIANGHLFSKVILNVLRQLDVPSTDEETMHFADTLDDAMTWLVQKPPIVTSADEA